MLLALVTGRATIAVLALAAAGAAIVTPAASTAVGAVGCQFGSWGPGGVMAAAVAVVVGAAYVAPGRLTQSCVLVTPRSWGRGLPLYLTCTSMAEWLAG
jgi:hypothetical protein